MCDQSCINVSSLETFPAWSSHLLQTLNTWTYFRFPENLFPSLSQKMGVSCVFVCGGSMGYVHFIICASVNTCLCAYHGECLCFGRALWSTGILLWVCVGLFSTRDAGSVDWNPLGHQGHLIPPLAKHWPKCSCIIHVYITLLLCKVFTQSFCRTIYCTHPLDIHWQTFPDLLFFFSVTHPFFHTDDGLTWSIDN